MINKIIGFCIFVVSLAVIAEPAVAQSLAGKTIRIIVPYAAGGTGDVVARVLAQAITQKTGQTIVVEDRPGASSIVGSEFAARAAPDGTTILLVENPFILSPILFPGHYDPVSSFEPLCYVAATPAVLAVSSKSDIHTLSDYLKLATSKPGAVSYGGTGPASIIHIAGELLKRDAKVDITYVPYPGSPPAMNATLAGTITAVMANYSDLKGQIEAGIETDRRAREKARRGVAERSDAGGKWIQQPGCRGVVRLCCARQDAKGNAGAALAIHIGRSQVRGRCRQAQEPGNVHQSFLRSGIRKLFVRSEAFIHGVRTRVRYQAVGTDTPSWPA